MRRAIAIGIVSALASLGAGCESQRASQAPDAGTSPDGAPAVPGLFIHWSVTPHVPGAVTTTLRIDTAFINVQNLWMVGDAGDLGPPDASNGLSWGTGTPPAAVAFSNAPLGLYSRIAFDLDSKAGGKSYELTGAVVLADTWFDFDISDDAKLDINVPIALTLAAGAQVTAPIAIDLGTALGVVDFASCATVGGKKVLGSDDEAIVAFRTALTQAFAIAGT